MAELVFDCVGAAADRYAAVPAMTLRLRIAETTDALVGAIALRCQVRIEPQRRRYSAEEADRLHDLFGATDRWADTLRPLQLASLSTMVPGFTGSTTHELLLPCTYDLEIASTKYFSALEDGVIPLLLLYSGTVFCVEDGRMVVAQVPWSKESAYPLPVSVWRETVALHFPTARGSGSAWTRWRHCGASRAAVRCPPGTAPWPRCSPRSRRGRTRHADETVQGRGHRARGGRGHPVAAGHQAVPGDA